MSRVADLLEDWVKDPAYAHDFAALARELQARCAVEAAIEKRAKLPAGRGKAMPDAASRRPRLKAKSA